jgi:hypothetical protein
LALLSYAAYSYIPRAIVIPSLEHSTFLGFSSAAGAVSLLVVDISLSPGLEEPVVDFAPVVAMLGILAAIPGTDCLTIGTANEPTEDLAGLTGAH